MTTKIKKMIGNVIAARVVDDTGAWLFELRTDGIVTWINPLRKDEAIDIFFENCRVSEDAQDELREAFHAGKLSLEQVDIALHGIK